MKENYQLYEKLIKSDTRDLEDEFGIKSFWDLIVITAISTKQKECYEKQIQTKLKNKNLPSRFKYLVFCDPENCKIGSGGSTLNVVKKLYEIYNDELYLMKILLIHAGGYSQRMPTCTVLGKIFSSIACGSNFINDMLDLKISIFTPFSIHMQPGILLSSSDDFVTFNFDEQISAGKYFGAENNDFVLISHKSSLQIAKDHGVYVRDKNLPNIDHIDLFTCRKVLQKPSIQKMIDENIVLHHEDSSEFVYTDSVFYFSHSTTKELIKFYDDYFEDILSNRIEIDAYRDMLQALGSSPLTIDEYLKSTNCKTDSDTVEKIYREFYKLFLGKNDLAICLKESDFYHLGTVNELLDLYLDNSSKYSLKFREKLNFSRSKINESNLSLQEDLKFVQINSKINSDKCSFSDLSLIEYCYIGEDVSLTLNEFCFISNCMVDLSEIDTKPTDNLIVPKNICIHTIPVFDKNSAKNCKYITVFFNRNDDLKRNYKNFESVKFLEETLGSILAGSRMLEELFKELTKEDLTSKDYSIWNLRIFKSYDTMTESFLRSLELLTKMIKFDLNSFDSMDYYDNKSSDFYSLFDVLKFQNYEMIINYRTERNLIN